MRSTRILPEFYLDQLGWFKEKSWNILEHLLETMLCLHRFQRFFFPLNLEDLMPKVKGPRQSRDALYEETHPVVCIVIEILHYVHSQIFNQMDVQAPQSMDRSPYQ
jgi:hypothetical protein